MKTVIFINMTVSACAREKCILDSYECLPTKLQSKSYGETLYRASKSLASKLPKNRTHQEVYVSAIYIRAVMCIRLQLYSVIKYLRVNVYWKVGTRFFSSYLVLLPPLQRRRGGIFFWNIKNSQLSSQEPAEKQKKLSTPGLHAFKTICLLFTQSPPLYSFPCYFAPGSPRLLWASRGAQGKRAPLKRPQRAHSHKRNQRKLTCLRNCKFGNLNG